MIAAPADGRAAALPRFRRARIPRRPPYAVPSRTGRPARGPPGGGRPRAPGRRGSAGRDDGQPPGTDRPHGRRRRAVPDGRGCVPGPGCRASGAGSRSGEHHRPEGRGVIGVLSHGFVLTNPTTMFFIG